MNEYLECIVKLQYGVEVGDRKELIHCEDCKHSCDYTDIFPDRAYKCIKNGGYHNGSWFCADGEKS